MLMDGIENLGKVTQEVEPSDKQEEIRILGKESSRKDDSPLIDEVEILTEGFISPRPRRNQII